MKIYEFYTVLQKGKILTNNDFTLKEHSDLDFLKEKTRYKVTIQELD